LPLASGMITGEALVAVFAAIYLAAIGRRRYVRRL
jgi:uncharacterized oligopeptide transporter (OPT) family protein